ncbi:MAG: DUF4918 family protein [Pirellulales bacterium]
MTKPSKNPTFAARMNAFNRNLRLQVGLPAGVAAMNPFRESPLALRCADAFYDKYYADHAPRWGIFGINPGRFGAGLTGVPFTDFKKLREICKVDVEGHSSNEPSSTFIYAMIAAMGGAAKFYRRYYINSLCPLGFVLEKKPGRWVNYNYYDDPAVFAAVKPFMAATLKRQIALGLRRETAFCLGKKNLTYFARLNDEFGFFGDLIELPHPRYVVQYKFNLMRAYVEEYRRKLRSVR